MLDMLWDIVIQPLVYLIELVFSLFYRFTNVPGLAIIGVSIAVNLFCLPLYRMADDAQERERQKQASMERWVTHIKKHFSGDEQYMMLSAYYLEQNYHPIQALVGSLSLLFQIPFFTAAYNYLSNLELLKGASFLFLSDLGNPDAMLTIGGFAINVMPVVMTLLNCVSTLIYTRGLPLRDKLQAYILAGVFLVLLYDSPSGLVFYWTCNQVFSLAKNIFMKLLKDPRSWALGIEQAAFAGAIGWFVLTGRITSTKFALVVAAAAIVFELLWVRAWKTRHVDGTTTHAQVADPRTITTQFLLAGVVLTVLLGVLIPSAVMADSPAEFLDMQNLTNPAGHLVHAACVWGGLVLLWLSTFFFLTPREARGGYGLALWVIAGTCLINYFVFGGGLGTISTSLVYDAGVTYTGTQQLLNLAVIAAAAVALAVVWKRANRLVTPALAIMAAGIMVISVPNVTAINRAYADARDILAKDTTSLIDENGDPKPILHLSSTNKNVVVVFLDRAISGYLPYIMAERPELEAQFDGFTYYPNTISYGSNTNFGAPALYGGYDYTPQAMNERPEKTLPQKHDEALLLLPTLFSEAGARSTVINPPYAGTYEHVSDLSIYDGLDNLDAYSITGEYAAILRQRYGITSARDMDRTFVMYGLFQAEPEFARGITYDDGNYLSTAIANPPHPQLLYHYAFLEMLPQLTDVSEGAGGFVQFCNETTHEPDMLQLPDYTPAEYVNNEGLEDMGRFTLDGVTVHMDGSESLATTRLEHYHVNVAALLKLGAWFDWMRAQGVYDNTRIIVVADHGRGLEQFDGWEIDPETKMNIQNVNPLFMVKDFDAHGFATSDEFMTNADTPTIALEGLVDHPVNPFTGNAVSSSEKTAHDQLVTSSLNWNTNTNRGATFDTSDGHWYAVHDNIFDLSNWKRIEEVEQ